MDANMERNRQTVRNFLRFLEEKDMGSWIDLWAEDGVNHYPYATGMFPERMEGKRQIYDNWKGVPDLFDSLQFDIHEMWCDNDANTVVVRFDSHNIMKGNAGRYDNTYVCIFNFDDEGRIREYYEYFNPITTGVTYGLIEVTFVAASKAR